MAGTVNKAILIGTLGRDPEMRFMPNGDAVASFSIATDEGYKDKTTGQRVDRTEWHRIEVFGRLAEVSGEYLKKGSKVYVEGKLKTDEYEKDGIKRYSTKIKAFSMTMLSPKNDQQSSQSPAEQKMPPMARREPQQASPQSAPQAQPSNSFDDFDDSIPF